MESDLKQHVTSKKTWIRGFYILLFAVIYSITEIVLFAVVLFQFGTGAVRGFAVTLSLGVIASMFTALILSRMIFDYILMNRKVKTLSI